MSGRATGERRAARTGLRSEKAAHGLLEWLNGCKPETARTILNVIAAWPGAEELRTQGYRAENIIGYGDMGHICSAYRQLRDHADVGWFVHHLLHGNDEKWLRLRNRLFPASPRQETPDHPAEQKEKPLRNRVAELERESRVAGEQVERAGRELALVKRSNDLELFLGPTSMARYNWATRTCQRTAHLLKTSKTTS